jgi:hypothetical protein
VIYSIFLLVDALILYLLRLLFPVSNGSSFFYNLFDALSIFSIVVIALSFLLQTTYALFRQRSEFTATIGEKKLRIEVEDSKKEEKDQ